MSLHNSTPRSANQTGPSAHSMRGVFAAFSPDSDRAVRSGIASTIAERVP
jgi:hypothetical protein